MRTRYANLSAHAARAVAVATLTAIAACFASLDATVALENTPPSSGAVHDIDLYRAILERLRAGESYYAVLATELPSKGYPTHSLFNWRPPTVLALLSFLPATAMGSALLGGVLLANLTLTWRALRAAAGIGTAALGLLLLALTLAGTFSNDFLLFSEFWAGSFMCLSVLLMACGHGRTAVAAGLAAALCREFGLLYCAAAWLAACSRGSWRTAWLWLGAILCALGYLAAHFHAVSAYQEHIGTSGSDWIRFGGLTFILSSTRFNPLLLVLPVWFVALYLPLALLGLLAWPGRAALPLQLATLIFLMTFFVIGRDVNYYWGALYAPLLALGAAWAPRALVDLWRRGRGQATASRSAATRVT